MRSFINVKISGFRLRIIPEPLVPRQEDRRLGERDWSYERLKTYFRTSAQEISAILGHFPILIQQ